MFFVRKLVLICLQNDILFKAKHVPGVQNTLEDSLSRLQVEKFKGLAPAFMDQSATDIPVDLQPQNWHPWYQHYCSLVFSLHPFQHIGAYGSLFLSFCCLCYQRLLQGFLFHPLSWLYLFLICMIMITLHELLIPMFLLWVIVRNYLGSQILQKYISLFRCLLKCYGKLGSRLDTRLPIILPNLFRCSRFPHTCWYSEP